MIHNQKLKRAIFISLILHVVVIVFLIVNAITKETLVMSGTEGNAIDAIMVDQSIMSQQYQRTQQQKSQAAKAAEERQKQREEQEKLLQEEQASRQEQLKKLEKERLAKEEQAKQAAELKNQQEEAAALALKKKQAVEEDIRRQQENLAKEQQVLELARQKAEEDARLKEKQIQEEKRKADEKLKEAEAIKKKADAEAKAKAEADKKAKAAEAKKKADQEKKAKQTEIDDLFGELSSSKNAPKAGGGGGVAGQKDVDAYYALVRQAIQSKFKDPGIYRGKTCLLDVKIAQDGLLLSVNAKSGDPALCREATVAAKLAVIPKPPSKAIYEKIKNSTIMFSPGSR